MADARLVVTVPAPDAGTGTPAASARAALASSEIAFEGETLVITGDRERTATLIASINQLLGRGGLFAVAEALQRKADDAARRGSGRLPLTANRFTGMGAVDAILGAEQTVADLWNDEVRRLDARISEWLIAVERRATVIVKERLLESRKLVAETRDRYLVGLPPADPAKREFPRQGGSLAPAAAEVRTFLSDFARMRYDIQEATREFQEQFQRGGLPPDRTTISEQQRAILAQMAAVQLFVGEKTRDSPLLSWMVNWTAEPVIDSDPESITDERLYERIHATLHRCWKSSWTVEQRIGAAPAERTAKVVGGWPEERVGGTIDDAEEGGPWRFPAAIQQALEECGWTPDSPQGASVTQVMGSAGGAWNESFAWMAGTAAVSVAVHLILPPVALAVDLIIAGIEFAGAVAQNQDRWIEHLAVFDRRRSLAPPPSGNAVIAAMLGVFIAPLDGAQAILANLVPVAVNSWTPFGPDTKP